MIALQLAFGLILTGLAAGQLRPVFRHQEEVGERLLDRLHAVSSVCRWHVLRKRSGPVPDNRPMLWKELHTGGPRGLARFIGLVLTTAGGAFLAYYTIRHGALAIEECWKYGHGPTRVQATPYGLPSSNWQATERESFYDFLVVAMPLIYLVGALAVATSGASAITTEREDHTWASLTTTELSGSEIIQAKQLGALQQGRRFAAMIMLLVAAGTAVGSVHALAIPALTIALAIYAWFAAALGVWISLQVQATWRAQFLTIALLLLINVLGQFLLNLHADLHVAPRIWMAFTPVVIGQLVFEPRFLQDLTAAPWFDAAQISTLDAGLRWQTIFSVLSPAAYGVLALALTWLAGRSFDTTAGRAQRIA
jgi:hypothetical protein